MKMTRKLLTGILAIGAIASAGCNPDQFNAFNEQFKTVKKTTNVLKNSSAPAAAMATSLTAVELMNALSNDSAKRAGAIIATGGGNIIATGGGNIIATGGGNYGVLQASGGVTTTYELAPGGSGFLKSVRGEKTLIDVTFNYNFASSDRRSSYAISNLKGSTNGFKIEDVNGTYSYDLSEDKKKQTIQANVAGMLKTSGGTFTLEKLTFAHSLPADNVKKELGTLAIDDNGNKLSAKVMIQGATVTASGELKDAKGNVLYTIEMDENGVKTNETEAPAADAK